MIKSNKNVVGYRTKFIVEKLVRDNVIAKMNNEMPSLNNSLGVSSSYTFLSGIALKDALIEKLQEEILEIKEELHKNDLNQIHREFADVLEVIDGIVYNFQIDVPTQHFEKIDLSKKQNPDELYLYLFGPALDEIIKSKNNQTAMTHAIRTMLSTIHTIIVLAKLDSDKISSVKEEKLLSSGSFKKGLWLHDMVLPNESRLYNYCIKFPDKYIVKEENNSPNLSLDTTTFEVNRLVRDNVLEKMQNEMPGKVSCESRMIPLTCLKGMILDKLIYELNCAVSLSKSNKENAFVQMHREFADCLEVLDSIFHIYNIREEDFAATNETSNLIELTESKESMFESLKKIAQKLKSSETLSILVSNINSFKFILESLIEKNYLDKKIIMDAKVEKLTTDGSFKTGLFQETITIPNGSRLHQYCIKNPDQFVIKE